MGCGGCLEQEVEGKEHEESRSEAKPSLKDSHRCQQLKYGVGISPRLSSSGFVFSLGMFLFQQRLTQCFGDRAGTLFRHSSTGETGTGVGVNNECLQRGFLFRF